MSASITQQLTQYLANCKQQGLYRARTLSKTSEKYLDFSCSDYLSFANDPRVRQAYCEGFSRYPVGSGGSMVLSGYHASHRALEQAFAQALQVDDCIIYSSGYVANLSVTSLLTHLGLRLIIDKAVHASVYDGLRLSHSNYQRFLHNNLQDLTQKLTTEPEPAAILTETTFSMSGLHAPLKDISNLAAQHQAQLIVDEAHGFGLVGPEGLGGVMAAGLSQEEVPLRVIPCGKALSGSGAIVAGKTEWIEALLQATRQPVYSTAISPAHAHGLMEVLTLIRQADDRRAYLHSLIEYFRQVSQASSLRWRDSISPIQQLQLGCPFLAKTYAEKLYAHQIQCFPIRQPTVTKQETGLRIILNYQHSFADIDYLFQVLQT